MAQIAKNTVSVTPGRDTIQFIKHPGGSFTPSAGSTMALLETNSTYWVQEPHGGTLKFDNIGRPTNIVGQYGPWHSNRPTTLLSLKPADPFLLINNLRHKDFFNRI